MSRSLRLRLEHIRHGIARIDQLTAGKTIQDYLVDEGLREMVERNIARVSEASRHIPQNVRTKYASIPWRRVVGIGNVIRHDYDEIDHTVMWQTATEKLLPLTAAVEAMLRDLDTKVDE
jgi:uncharacterized protein with HEPN domain